MSQSDDSSTVDLIARTAIDHYSNVLPKNKGKPQQGQWTVYSAIVATRRHTKSGTTNDNDDINNEAWVVSCATGSKCATMQPALSHFGDHIPECQGKGLGICKEKCCIEQIKGFVLHDSHAEVLARRGLVRVLWQEINYHIKHSGESICEEKMQRNLLHVIMEDKGKQNYEEKEGPHQTRLENLTFELKNDIQLHLYISDSPCGDASIYDIYPKYASNINNESNNGLSFTGAKIVVPQDDETTSNNYDNFFQCSGSMSKPKEGTTKINPLSKTMIARERVQIKSALRLKSGRSNIPNHLRSSSMSCSDKICRWITMGLQGSGALARFIPKPISLKRVVVSRDPRIIEPGSDSQLNPQLEALERAIVSRAQNTLKSIMKDHFDEYHDFIKVPSVHISNHIFTLGKANSEKLTIDKNNAASIQEHDVTIEEVSKKKGKGTFDTTQTKSKKRSIENPSQDNEPQNKKTKKQKISPCGISLNWQIPSLNERDNQGDVIEQVVGAKGIVQRKKPKNSNDILKCASRLCRYSIWNQTLEALSLCKIITLGTKCQHSTEKNFSYQQMKNTYTPPTVRNLTNLVLCDIQNPLQGWIKNSFDDDFYPHDNISL